MDSMKASAGAGCDRRRFLSTAGIGIAVASAGSFLPWQLAAAAAAAAGDAIRPFHVNVPEKDLVDLRRRIAATRWPDRETVDDRSQGAQLAKFQELVRYWGTGYDWRKAEAKLNALPQFVTTIDGVDIHFIHVRSRHPNALPIIITHGWPGSDHRAAQDHRSADGSDRARRPRRGRLRRRDPVDAGLRLLRQANRRRLGPGPHRARLGRTDEAPRLHPLRRAGRRLGCADLKRDGAPKRAAGLLGIHINLPATVPPEVAAVLGGGPVPAGLSEQGTRGARRAQGERDEREFSILHDDDRAAADGRLRRERLARPAWRHGSSCIRVSRSGRTATIPSSRRRKTTCWTTSRCTG